MSCLKNKIKIYIKIYVTTAPLVTLVQRSGSCYANCLFGFENFQTRTVRLDIIKVLFIHQLMH